MNARCQITSSFVVLISGDVGMVLASDDGDKTVRLSEPGSLVIVSCGIRHTAKVHEPTQIMFVTPGERTVNREQLLRDGG